MILFGGGARLILIYRDVDISSEIAPMVTSFNYNDKEHGEADDIDVTVQDSDGRWRGSWKPDEGDVMVPTIVDSNGSRLPCGEFEMDEPQSVGGRNGDTMVIRGLAVPITKSLRTQKSWRFVITSLKSFVYEVGGATGLQVEGDIKAIQYVQKAQRRERDLEFLKRLGEETGHYVNVRGQKLIFTNFKSLDSQSAAFQIFHGDRRVTKATFQFQTKETYSKAKVSYLDARTKEKIEHEEPDPDVKTGDTLSITERVEDKSQAEELAKSRLHMKNRHRKIGTYAGVGDSRVMAGVVAEASGFGQYDDNYLFQSTAHAMSRSGHTCSGKLVLARAR